MGKPLVNKVLTARNITLNKPSMHLLQEPTAKTSVLLSLAVRVTGFIHSTHMIPYPDKADSDWESFWASYSFGLE